jgi:hypothetical protein
VGFSGQGWADAEFKLLFELVKFSRGETFEVGALCTGYPSASTLTDSWGPYTMTPSDTSLSNVVVRASSDRSSMLKSVFWLFLASSIASRKMSVSLVWQAGCRDELV